MLRLIVWNRTVYMYKINLALNNLQWFICHKTKRNKWHSHTIIFNAHRRQLWSKCPDACAYIVTLNRWIYACAQTWVLVEILFKYQEFAILDTSHRSNRNTHTQTRRKRDRDRDREIETEKDRNVNTFTVRNLQMQIYAHWKREREVKVERERERRKKCNVTKRKLQMLIYAHRKRDGDRSKE